MANRRQDDPYIQADGETPYETRMEGQCVSPQSEERSTVIIAAARGFGNTYEGTGFVVKGNDLIPDVTPYTPPTAMATNAGTPAKPNTIPYAPADAFGKGNPQ